MHADEVETDAPLVRRLLAVQFPEWAGLPIGWALSVGLIALPYYLETNPALVRYARRLIGEVLADLDSARVLYPGRES